MVRRKEDPPPAEFEGCTVLRETERALLVQIPDNGEDVWVPKSQLDEGNELDAEGDEGVLVVKAWWAEKRRLV